MRAVNIGPYIEFILITDMLVSRFYCNCPTAINGTVPREFTEI